VTGEIAWTAPGTTTIESADFEDVIERNDAERQTSRLQLAGGSGAPPTDDYYPTFAQARTVDAIHLESLGGDATSAIVRMLTPPCSAAELAASPPTCPRAVATGSQSVLKVGSVDLTLSDDDAPTATASGPLRQLADQWTQATEPLSVDLDFSDPGSGTSAWTFSSTDADGDHDIQMSGPLCDEAHLTPGMGSTICPFHSAQHGIVLDPSGLPQGQNRFAAAATDAAGNSSAGDSWNVYVDRGKPTIAAGGPLTDARDTWIDPADLAATVHLSAHDDRSGIQHTDLTATDAAGVRVVDTTSDACAVPGAPGQPCPNDYADDVALNTATLPEGELTFSAGATDHVGLASDPQSWTLRLDRTPPIARAEGDLVALQGQWTNQTGTVSTTLDGRDALSGVARLDLLAVNDDGRHVIASTETCAEPADKSQADGSCPRLTSATIALNASDLPDGQNHFEVQAHDLAGHTSRPQDTWDTYIDHTPPPEPTGLTVVGTTVDTLSVRWNPVVDVPEGVAGVSYQYRVLDAGTPITQWISSPYPAAIIPGLSPGVAYKIELCAADRAGNQSKCDSGEFGTLAQAKPSVASVLNQLGFVDFGNGAAAAASTAALAGIGGGLLRSTLADAAKAFRFGSFALVFLTEFVTSNGNLDCELGPTLYDHVRPIEKAAHIDVTNASRTKVGSGAIAPLVNDITWVKAQLASETTRINGFLARNKNLGVCENPYHVALKGLAATTSVLTTVQDHLHELDVSPAKLEKFYRRNHQTFAKDSPKDGRYKARIALRTCEDRATEKECDSTPIFAPGKDIEAATDHDRDAINAGKPFRLSFTFTPNAPRGWYSRTKNPNACTGRDTDLYDCDEYPYLSTQQGVVTRAYDPWYRARTSWKAHSWASSMGIADYGAKAPDSW